jgi:hypothetical protein
LRETKLSHTAFQQFEVELNSKLRQIEIANQKSNDQQRSLENFVEKYVPLTVQQRIVETCESFLSRSKREKLQARNM